MYVMDEKQEGLESLSNKPNVAPKIPKTAHKVILSIL